MTDAELSDAAEPPDVPPLGDESIADDAEADIARRQLPTGYIRYNA